MPKDRGIDKLNEERFGDLLEKIDSHIEKYGEVKILDAGCGFGVTMLGFVKKYGSKVEIEGFNYDEKSGTQKIMKNEAIKKRIFTKEEIKKIKNFPKIKYIDASRKLPYKSKSFDFVYGMASIYLFDDKIRFLSEVNRVLKPNGIGRFNAIIWDEKMYHKNPPEYMLSWEIWNKGKRLTPEQYFKKIKGVKIGYYKGKPKYLDISGNKKINFGVKFLGSIDANFVWHEFGGVKSIYTTQINFKPRYK